MLKRTIFGNTRHQSFQYQDDDCCALQGSKVFIYQYDMMINLCYILTLSRSNSFLPVETGHRQFCLHFFLIPFSVCFFWRPGWIRVKTFASVYRHFLKFSWLLEKMREIPISSNFFCRILSLYAIININYLSSARTLFSHDVPTDQGIDTRITNRILAHTHKFILIKKTLS